MTSIIICWAFTSSLAVLQHVHSMLGSTTATIHTILLCRAKRAQNKMGISAPRMLSTRLQANDCQRTVCRANAIDAMLCVHDWLKQDI